MIALELLGGGGGISQALCDFSFVSFITKG